ncbi:MAG: hypothetical protein HQM09_03460 [Candidatus Riflebacteria bacterium]|nr:hypothetical protein [Candidatus Riflebacteria bacterium]
MKKRVLFRADGGLTIGLGHAMRCRTLGVELRKRGWTVGFMGTELPASFVTADCFELIEDPYGPLRVGTLAPSHGKTLREIATKWKPDLLIIDHYGFTVDDFATLCRGPWALGAIDDLADRMLPVEVVINPNPLASDEVYRRQGIPVTLTGEVFTLIRPEILSLRRDEGTPTDGPTVISLGGGNVEKITMKILDAFSGHSNRLVQVVVSPDCPKHLLREWVAERPQGRSLHDEPQLLAGLLASAGIAITGGGGTLWEVYALGIASLAVVFADNQRRTPDIVGSRKTGLCLDMREAFPTAAGNPEIEHVISTMFALAGNSVERRVMIERQRRLIDGLGAVRAADRLEILCRERN